MQHEWLTDRLREGGRKLVFLARDIPWRFHRNQYLLRVDDRFNYLRRVQSRLIFITKPAVSIPCINYARVDAMRAA